MAKNISCECGHVIRGENEDELIANAEDHMRDAHPDLVGQVPHDDLLAMADDA